jgi:hypothetical protein
MPPPRRRKKASKRKGKAIPKGFKHASRKFDEAEASQRTFVPRFFMKTKEKARVVFLDAEPHTVLEHVIPDGVNQRTGKRKFRNITSPKTWDNEADDPLVDAGNKPATVWYFTILDGRQRETRDGKKVKWEKKIIGFKMQAYDILRRRLARIKKRSGGKKGLRFAVFECRRGSSDREPSTGIDWEFIGHLPRAKIARMAKMADREATIEPIDFDDVLGLIPAKELRGIAKRFEAKMDSGEDDDYEDDDDLDDDDEPSDEIFDDDDKDKDDDGDDDDDLEEDEDEALEDDDDLDDDDDDDE